MENTGIQNNEYQTLLKIKKNIKNQIIFNIAELVKVENYTHIFYKYFILDASKNFLVNFDLPKCSTYATDPKHTKVN